MVINSPTIKNIVFLILLLVVLLPVKRSLTDKFTVIMENVFTVSFTLTSAQSIPPLSNTHDIPNSSLLFLSLIRLLGCDQGAGWSLHFQGTTPRCINVAKDPDNCGHYGTVCPPDYLGHGSAACHNGHCALSKYSIFSRSYFTKRNRWLKVTDHLPALFYLSLDCPPGQREHKSPHSPPYCS